MTRPLSFRVPAARDAMAWPSEPEPAPSRHAGIRVVAWLSLGFWAVVAVAFIGVLING